MAATVCSRESGPRRLVALAQAGQRLGIETCFGRAERAREPHLSSAGLVRKAFRPNAESRKGSLRKTAGHSKASELLEPVGRVLVPPAGVVWVQAVVECFADRALMGERFDFEVLHPGRCGAFRTKRLEPLPNSLRMTFRPEQVKTHNS
jgi:hypothetical protein